MSTPPTRGESFGEQFEAALTKFDEIFLDLEGSGRDPFEATDAVTADTNSILETARLDYSLEVGAIATNHYLLDISIINSHPVLGTIGEIKMTDADPETDEISDDNSTIWTAHNDLSGPRTEDSAAIEMEPGKHGAIYLSKRLPRAPLKRRPSESLSAAYLRQLRAPREVPKIDESDMLGFSQVLTALNICLDAHRKQMDKPTDEEG